MVAEESLSTDSLLELFPMFGHPGISALEYVGQAASRNTVSSLGSYSSSAAVVAAGPGPGPGPGANVGTAAASSPGTTITRRSPSLYYRSSNATSRRTHDDNQTPPTTAGTDRAGAWDLSPSTLLLDNTARKSNNKQSRSKREFRNYTPRNFEMESSSRMQGGQGRVSRTASSENYSRPRLSFQSRSPSYSPTLGESAEERSSTGSRGVEDTVTLIANSPSTTTSKEVDVQSLKSRGPLTLPHQRSSSAPQARDYAYIPRTASTASRHTEGSGRDVKLNSPQRKEWTRPRRQTPLRLTPSKPVSTSRHTSLEHWVADHRRKDTASTIESETSYGSITGAEEKGTCGVIQQYFDNRTTPYLSSGRVFRHARSPSPPHIPLPVSPEKASQRPFRDQHHAIFPIEEVETPNETPPEFPLRHSSRPVIPPCDFSALSLDNDFIVASNGNYSPYDKNPNRATLKTPKSPSQRRIDVGEAAHAGSSHRGRIAPPILGHTALTTSENVGLNDLSYYLKHTGPAAEPQSSKKPHARKAMKIFRVGRRNPHLSRSRKRNSIATPDITTPRIPSCAKEVTTTGGAKHRRIVIPTEALSGYHPLAFAGSAAGGQAHHHRQRSRHISITFTDEMLNPLASPRLEHMISSLSVSADATTSPVAVSLTEEDGTAQARTPSSKLTPPQPSIPPKPTPTEPVREAVHDHPLATREELTRARKLRDLQRVKRKPTPMDFSNLSGTKVVDTTNVLNVLTPDGETHSVRAVGGQQVHQPANAPPTPAQTPEPESPTGPPPRRRSMSSVAADLDENARQDDSAVEVEEPTTAELLGKLQERVVYLQRQNTQLTEALARFVGVEMREGDLKGEDVLRVARSRA